MATRHELPTPSPMMKLETSISFLVISDADSLIVVV